MADRTQKQPLNISGRLYVDVACIDCDLCRITAPANFRANEEDGYSYVYKQPESAGEEEECRRALEECPVEAIGADGDGAAGVGSGGAG
jgi:ferredoxin